MAIVAAALETWNSKLAAHAENSILHPRFVITAVNRFSDFKSILDQYLNLSLSQQLTLKFKLFKCFTKLISL